MFVLIITHCYLERVLRGAWSTSVLTLYLYLAICVNYLQNLTRFIATDMKQH